MSNDESSMVIERQGCEVIVRTLDGALTLALIDASSNIIDSETVVDRVREALLDALFNEFAPQLKRQLPESRRDSINVTVDRRDCQVVARTPDGPGKLALIDASGVIVGSDTLVDRVRDVLIEALFDEFAPHLKKHSRVLSPPQPRYHRAP